MTTRKQVLISAGLIVAAVVTVAAVTVTGADPVTSVPAGHDHSAMAAAEATGPVTLDPAAARRIGVSYATATMQPLARTLELVGNVTYDETQLRNVNPKIEGWVERLHVDFTGAPVVKGQPLLAVYSPMLVAAQEELLLAKRLVETAAGSSERAMRNAQDMLDAARRRLRYWDIPESEIARVERTGEPVRTLTLRAPTSGIVIEKMVVEGTRIMPGMDLYRIADLSTVWVEGEVYEKDLAQVRVGQGASVSLEAYPGERFTGRVTYVYPTLSMESRTGRVRVALANPDMRIKPGMYARLALEAGTERSVLMVPRTAVHFTGTRAVAWMRHGDDTLVPHDVVTGAVSGDLIEIVSGLSEGAEVVRSASFLVDAESSLGPGMQAAPAAGADPHAGHGAAPAAKPAADPHAGH